MSKFKVGILGYGKMGQVYGRWFEANPNCEVSAIYNHSEEKRSKVSKDFPKAFFYTDWQELIRNKEIDIIGICTATYEKYPQICAAISEKKYIMCEKPICMDLDEFYKIKAILDNEIKFLVASELRLHPVIKTVNRLIPDLGQIFHIALDFSMYREEVKWKHRYEAGGGILRELGQHLLDVANIWLGEPVKVYGNNMIINPNRQVEYFSINMIGYKTGALVRLTNHYYEHGTNTYNGKIYGTDAQIDFCISSYDAKDAWIKYYDRQGMREIPVAIPTVVDDIYPGHMDSFKWEVDGFIDSILKNKKVDNSLDNEELTMQIMCASYESSRNGNQVILPLKEFSRKKINESFHSFYLNNH